MTFANEYCATFESALDMLARMYDVDTEADVIFYGFWALPPCHGYRKPSTSLLVGKTESKKSIVDIYSAQ